MKLTLVTPPAVEPVTLAEAKLHLRVDQDAENDLITRLIKAARAWCEHLSGRAFLTQTWRLSLDEFPESGIVLPRPTLQSVTSVAYKDPAGGAQTLGAGLYQVDAESEPGVIVPAPGQTWPDTEADRINAVQITFVAGETSAANLDPRVLQAVLLLVGHWYANREDVVTGTISKEVEHAARELMRQLWDGMLY